MKLGIYNELRILQLWLPTQLAVQLVDDLEFKYLLLYLFILINWGAGLEKLGSQAHQIQASVNIIFAMNNNAVIGFYLQPTYVITYLNTNHYNYVRDQPFYLYLP